MSEQKRKIGKIVFDRPPLRTGKFFLFAGLGLLLGAIFGGVFWLFMTREAGEVVPVLVMKECWPYFLPSMLIGLLAGIIFGWGWKRPIQPRIEMVDPPRERRRGPASTALARVDISGRSRY